jgi:aspartate racemase
LIKEEAIDGLILGCTELPMILKNGDCTIPFLNTVEIHVASIIEELKKSL